MSDAPLTEKRFIELFAILFDEAFDKKIAPIKADIAELKKDVAELKKDMIEVKGFISHESKAIEYEIGQILKKYLRDTYPTKTIKQFNMKRLYDPYSGKELTELDAAFILEQYSTQKDYSRLKKYNLPFPSKETTENIGKFFILAEAKHFIDKNKIKQKLKQFEIIIKLFSLAKSVKSNNLVQGISEKFKKLVEYNKYLTEITEYILVFGAAYWEGETLLEFENDIEKRKRYIINFLEATDDKKVDIYKKICDIEKNWYDKENLPNNPVLSDTAILALTNIGGAMSHIKIIKPSGHRFTIVNTNEVAGVTQYPLKGGKTRRKTHNN